MSQISEKYARALVKASLDKKCLKSVRDDFRAFISAVSKSTELRFLLLNKGLSSEREKIILDKAVGGKVSVVFKRFLEVIVNKSREPWLKEIQADFERFADDAENKLKAIVYSAVPLTPQLKESFRHEIAVRLSKDIYIDNRIDASLLGGAVIRIGDKVIDNSIKNYLKQLGKELAKC